MPTKAGPYSGSEKLLDLSKKAPVEPTSGPVQRKRPDSAFYGPADVEDSVHRGEKLMGIDKNVGPGPSRRAAARAPKLQGKG